MHVTISRNVMQCRNSWRQMQLSQSKLCYLSIKLHGVTSQKTVILIIIAVKTLYFKTLAWNPAQIRTGYRSSPYTSRCAYLSILVGAGCARCLSVECKKNLRLQTLYCVAPVSKRVDYTHNTYVKDVDRHARRTVCRRWTRASVRTCRTLKFLFPNG
jgi:hypothetical protein